jgi:hypothetical protein
MESGEYQKGGTGQADAGTVVVQFELGMMYLAFCAAAGKGTHPYEKSKIV